MEPKITEKAWNPELEARILEGWQEADIYRFVPGEDNYTIDTPPPYPSGRPWHIGAAAHYSQIDMIARTARMGGRNVYFPVGIDRNGLPVEIYTEKKHGIRMRETERGRFLELCREALDDLEAEMILIMTSLGISGDLDGHYRTDSEEYRALTQSTFITLWREGRIALATRPNNYDWVSGTTIADAEIAYQELPTRLVHMRFGVAGEAGEAAGGAGAGTITIASTRPELLCACRAVIVNPEDERYAGLVGRMATVPITGAEVEIRAHSSARRDFGSGAVMVCSYGDQNDVALFREMDLGEIVAVGLDGRMTEAAGAYAGLRPKQARERITADLEAGGFVERIEEISHRTPVSERSKVPIEIIPMEEYYLRQRDSVQRMRELASEITFHPPMHRQILMNWLDSISMDWPISRRRYYGTEIPVWHCTGCSETYVPEPGRYYQPWREPCPQDRCGRCGSTEFAGEERTFDTWMDSSVSPLFVSGYGRDEELFGRVYPVSIRPQAKDIVRTWLYYTLLRCDQLTGKRPWSEAWIMGYGLDEWGMKMSKSKGNAIDPLPLIERFGADTFRFWSASEVNHGHDFRCNEQKIESTKKFLSKLWNVSRFLSGFPAAAGFGRGGNGSERPPPPPPDAMAAADRWILSELDGLVGRCREGYEKYNFFVPAIAVREFVWNVFAAHYIEMVKKRAYGDGFSDAERDAAVYTLHRTLSTVLKLLAPITPFITEYLWQALYSEGSIHLERHAWAEEGAGAVGAGEAAVELTDELVRFNSRVWNEKKAGGLSLRDSIAIEVPQSLAGFEKDLRAMHNLE